MPLLTRPPRFSRASPAPRSKPVPLIKYVAAAKWRPVPLFVDVTVDLDGSPDVTDGAGGEPAAPRMRAVVQTNPQLKSTLQNVTVSMTPPSTLAIDSARWAPQPDGSSYDPETRTLKWRVCKELVRDHPMTCLAPISGAGLDDSASAESLLVGTPFHVQFGCDGVTISGIELEVQLVAGHSVEGAVPPIAKLIRRFTAGEYRVTPPKPSAGSIGADGHGERESRGSRE